MLKYDKDIKSTMTPIPTKFKEKFLIEKHP